MDPAGTDSGTLIRHVAAFRRALVLRRIARTVLKCVFALLLCAALLQPLFSLFPWTLLPVVLDAAGLGALLFAAGYAIALLIFRTPGFIDTARLIESQGSGHNPLLALALELKSDPATRENVFTDQACAHAAARLPSLPRSPAPVGSTRGLVIATVLLFLWCMFNPLPAPRLFDYVGLPFSSLSGADVVVSPGTVTVPANRAVTLGLDVSGARYPSCRLALYSTDGERLSRHLLRPDGNGDFAYRVDSVSRSFVYRFIPQAVSLPAETIHVVPPPRLYGLSIQVHPPAYTGKRPRILAEGQGNFDAYIGSKARIAIVAPRLSRAWLLRGADSLPMTVTPAGAESEFRVDGSCRYTFGLRDTLGQKNAALPVFQVNVIPDEPPLVHIVKPGFDKILAPEQVETLWVEGVDDIGIRSMELGFRLGGQRNRETGSRDLTIPGAPPVMRSSLIWHVAELSLYRGDTVFYWARARDTKPYGRPQYAISDTFWFRIPSFEEAHERLAGNRDQTRKTLGAVHDRQGEIGRELEKVIASATKNNELSWEQKQIVKDLASELEQQADSMELAVRKLEENIEQLKQEGTIGEEVAQKYEEVRKAVEELTAAYGDSLLFTMDDSDKPISWREMRAALEKTRSLLPRLEEQLDNVLTFLDMLKRDQELAELAMRAEQLSKEQAALSQSDHSRDMMAQRQKELLDRIETLSRDVEKTARDAGQPDGLFDSAGTHGLFDSLQQAMQSALAARQLPSRESMRQMSGSLLSLSQELMRMMNFNLAARMEQERSALLALSRDALALAEWQKELQERPISSDDRAPAALGQQALRDALKKSMKRADELSMVPPKSMLSIGRGYKDALRASDRVIESLSSGDGSMAMSSSGASLRNLAKSLLAALSDMEGGSASQGSGGACMMPGLRKLSGRQAAINAVTADLLRSMLGGGQRMATSSGTGEAQAVEQARKEAQRAQQAIADGLKELAGKYGEEAGEAMQSKVAHLEEEARRLASMLTRPSAEVSSRQDRFLARMLETTLSLHRQGEGKEEWKSRTAKETFEEIGIPERGTAFKDVDAFHLLRRKAFQGNFPETYRKALRDYFESLSERYLK
ncbi:MAG: hypothetical protein JW768_15250 [Chitinispirillaceae bacterium]|nr:hypothetical protein [Chitinispirillaceae bacterium]